MIDHRKRAIGFRGMRRTSLMVTLPNGGLHLLRLKKLLPRERRWDTRREAGASRGTVLRWVRSSKSLHPRRVSSITSVIALSMKPRSGASKSVDNGCLERQCG